jgi:hypothetical protein
MKPPELIPRATTFARLGPHSWPFAAIDAVVPARNEAATLGAVIEALRLGGCQVIVVDDRSTDDTAAAAAVAGAARIVPGPRRGKGAAMAAGLEYVTTDRVLFCDADLRGLTPAHVRTLVDCPTPGMVVGLRPAASHLPAWLPPISGERCLPTAVARAADLAQQGWRAELALDAAVVRAGLPSTHISLAGLDHAVGRNPLRALQVMAGALPLLPELLLYPAGEGRPAGEGSAKDRPPGRRPPSVGGRGEAACRPG